MPEQPIQDDDVTSLLKAALAAALSCALLSAPAIAHKPSEKASERGAVQAITGSASWYGPGFHGRRTANGEQFDQNAMTAAHKTLPFGTRVRVTKGERSVVVRINDRGPFVRGREIDLSKGAAQAVGMISAGIARVRLEVLP